MQAGEEDAHDGGDQSPEVPDPHCPSRDEAGACVRAAEAHPSPQAASRWSRCRPPRRILS